MSVEPIRLVVADDHSLFREGLRALLSAIPDIELVGEAATGEATIELVAKSQPDIVLMDINMPGINGIDAARTIRNATPSTGVIMVTMLEDDASLFAAMRAGARGYVLKGAHHEELLQTIRTVANGQVLFGAGIASRIMNFFYKLEDDPVATLPESLSPELTPRELEILTLIAQGISNQQIAHQLVISDKTVRNHITSIFSKLQVADRAQAIIKARGAGLGN